MNRPDESAFEEFGAAYWEDRYRNGVGTSRLDPSPSLVTETGGLRPGRALDAGCGVGGDALWLAAHGWHVTAVDVSITALEQGHRTAQAAGPAFAERIEWSHGDLTAWQPGHSTFDLVSSHYVHVPGPPEILIRRLASWVAPGGSLWWWVTTAGTATGPGTPTRPARRSEPSRSSPACARIVVAESRTHTIQRTDGGGPVTLDDVVVHARRRAATRP